MNTVTIIHNMHVISEDRMTRGNDHGACGPFFDFCGSCVARIAYSYATERDDLNQIYEDNQNGISEITGRQSMQEKLGIRARSLSMGDVVQVGSKSYKVAMIGFEEIDTADVVKALNMKAPEGFEVA